jgi:adenylylsulfate kinase
MTNPHKPRNTPGTICRRPVQLAQKGCVLWFTGLSGAGKSTIAEALQATLKQRGVLTFLLDGDIIRQGLCRDLGFSEADRNENIRRLAEVTRLFAECGVVALTAFISPLRAAREDARRIVGPERFLEIHVATDLRICEQRDVKGLYRQARAGAIPEFTGISSPYEPPENPALRLDTAVVAADEAVRQVQAMLELRGFIW